MLDRLAEIETKYEDLAEQINDPDVCQSDRMAQADEGIQRYDSHCGEISGV